MGLLDRFAREDDPDVIDGIFKDFGNTLFYLGIFRSMTKDKMVATVIFYSFVSLLLAFFIGSMSYTVYLAMPILSEIITLVHLALLIFLSLMIVHAAFLKKPTIDRLFRYFYVDLNPFSYSYDPIIGSFHLTRANYTKLITKTVLFLISAAGIIVILLEPLLNFLFDEEIVKIEGILYGIPIPMYWPLDHENYFLGFLFPNFLQLTASFAVVCMISGMVCIYSSVCLHIYCQLKVLLHNIKTLDDHVKRAILQDNHGQVKVRPLSLEALDYYNTFVRDIVQHHILLIDCFEHVNEIGQWILLTLFLSGGIDIAMAAILVFFVEARIGSLVTAIYFSLTEILIFGAVTFMSDILTDMSMEIQTEVYMLNWYLMRREVKQSLLIILTCSQKSLSFKAGNLIPVDKEMFSSIMQTAYSFINLVAAAKSE